MERLPCKFDVGSMVEDVTDLNELRVTVVDDYLEYFGGGCPRAEERADRLRATLRGVFHREHSTDLSGPAGGPKGISGVSRFFEG